MNTLVASDNTRLVVTLLNQDRKTFPLSGATVELVWKIGTTNKQTRSMNVVDTTSSTVAYRFGIGELTPGIFSGEVRATDSSGNTYTTQRKFHFRVRGRV